MKILQVITLVALVSISSAAFAKDKKEKAGPDKDGNGQISKEELAAQPERIQTKLKAADKNNDGELNAEEYAAYLKENEKKGSKKK